MDSLALYQPKNGYCYNSDSLFLFAFARAFLKNDIFLLDVGAGCGILGLLCARDFRLDLTMVEKNNLMIDFIKRNLKANNMSAKVLNCDVLEADLSGFDVIISNPPFYRKDIVDSKNISIAMAKNSKNLEINSFVCFAKRALKPKGRLIFCYDAKEIGSVFGALNQCGLNAEYIRFVHPREQKEANLALISARFAKTQAKIMPPLYNFSDKNYSQEAQEIFKLCATCSIKV